MGYRGGANPGTATTFKRRSPNWWRVAFKRRSIYSQRLHRCARARSNVPATRCGPTLATVTRCRQVPDTGHTTQHDTIRNDARRTHDNTRTNTTQHTGALGGGLPKQAGVYIRIRVCLCVWFCGDCEWATTSFCHRKKRQKKRHVG